MASIALRKHIKSKEKRRSLKNAVKRSKARHFQELCDAADIQPFGLAYKIVMGKLARQPMPSSATQLSRIYSIPPDNGVRLLTNDEEVLALSAGIMIAKATGPDEIPNVAIKHIIAAHPDLFADLYNAFWRERCQGDGRSNV
ncbi:hypothetical protein ACLKA6_000215 [Drosophila palustris]